MSDTPRCDQHVSSWSNLSPGEVSTMDFARQLERELNDSQAKLSTVYQWICRNHPDGFIDSLTHLQNLERVTDLHHDRLDAAERELAASQAGQAKWQALADGLAMALQSGLTAWEMWANYWRTSPAYGNNQPNNHPTHQAEIDSLKAALAAYESAAKGEQP